MFVRFARTLTRATTQSGVTASLRNFSSKPEVSKKKGPPVYFILFYFILFYFIFSISNVIII
jgi:hypothetical protein